MTDPSAAPAVAPSSPAERTAPDSPRPAASPRRRSRRASGLVKHAVLIVVGIAMLYPLLWMVLGSFRTDSAIFQGKPVTLDELTLENYTNGWTALDWTFGLFMWNSLVITVGSIVGNLISCSMTAYAFARLRFRGNRLFFAIMLLTVMLPGHVLLVPQYVLFSKLGWLNTFLPMIVPKFLAVDAFFIFLMVQFIRGIPRDLDEAATIDGAGPFRVFRSIILPLMTPALATTAIFTFIWTWNDFMGPLIYLTDAEHYTAQLALRQLIDSSGSGASGSSWGQLFAMSTVSLLPIFIVFLVGQRFLIRGIQATGGK